MFAHAVVEKMFSMRDAPTLKHLQCWITSEVKQHMTFFPSLFSCFLFVFYCCFFHLDAEQAVNSFGNGGGGGEKEKWMISLELTSTLLSLLSSALVSMAWKNLSMDISGISGLLWFQYSWGLLICNGMSNRRLIWRRRNQTTLAWKRHQTSQGEMLLIICHWNCLMTCLTCYQQT